MSKRFVVGWYIFWVIVTLLIILFFPRAEVSEHKEVCVGTGGRAWNIAREQFPGEDPRRVVAQIEALNPDKDITRLKPGELIKLPKGDR